MKLTVVISSVGIALLIIGFDQTLRFGIEQSYWIFMLGGFTILFSQYIGKSKEKENPTTNSTKPTSKKQKTSSPKKKKRKR